MNNATFICILAVLIIVFLSINRLPSYTNDNEVGEQTLEMIEEEPEPSNVRFVPPPYLTVNHNYKTKTQLINDLKLIPKPHYDYERYVYDCSEMAAYMEYQLENRGYDTSISCSYTTRHAWVTIHNIIGYGGVDIECIPPVHFISEPHKIEKNYNNITEALASAFPEDWDWWVYRSAT